MTEHTHPPGSAPALTSGRSRLGEILVTSGAITQRQLDHALEQQAALKLPLGQVLLKLGSITDEAMRQALSLQLNVPYLDLEKVIIDRALAQVISRSFAKRHSLMPVAQIGRSLTVAIDDPTATAVIEELAQLTGQTITVVTSSSKAIQSAFLRIYDELPEAAERARAASAAPAPVAAPPPPAPHAVAPAAVTAPAAALSSPASKEGDELIHRLLDRALERESTDIHLESRPTRTRVRFRVDGVLQQPELGALQAAMDVEMRAVTARLKALAGLDQAESRHPQAGTARISVKRGGDAIPLDVRVSIIPTPDGDSVVLRLLDRTRAPKGIDQLDLSPIVAARLQPLINRASGVLLVTGPVHAGKATTLHACLRSLQRPDISIVTVEDPIEYRSDDWSQAEVSEAAGNTYASYIRAFLRHDPEVILVGEIRDAETARLAFLAAQAGHLVFSTLQTDPAIAALPRLRDLGVEPSLVGASLIGVMAQRLARGICPACRHVDTPSAAHLAALFAPAPSDLKFYRGAGCAECGFTGYQDCMVLADLWVPDAQDLMLITHQAPPDELRVSAARTTFSMAEDAHNRLRSGRTTPEELVRVLPPAALADHRARFSA